MSTRHGSLFEGAIAGALGASAVALWFLGVDLVAGTPLATPTLLGRALLDVFGPRGGESDAFLVAFYTVFHYAAFIMVGTVLATIIHKANRQPEILAGLLIMFVAFEAGFYILLLMFSQPDILGSLAWYQAGAGNLLASITMGVFLWRRHPALRAEFAHALGED